jgi:hypothetical protein
VTGIEAAQYLHDQARQHDDVKLMIAKIDLATLSDDELIALANAVADMNDEAPEYETMTIDDHRDITEIL